MKSKRLSEQSVHLCKSPSTRSSRSNSYITPFQTSVLDLSLHLSFSQLLLQAIRVKMHRTSLSIRYGSHTNVAPNMELLGNVDNLVLGKGKEKRMFIINSWGE